MTVPAVPTISAMLIQEPANSIDASAVVNLLLNGIAESKYLEYKVALPGNEYEARKEFLADITAFANAEGGDIFFGIEAKDGVPTAIPGVVTEDLDAEILRLESMARGSIAPRIPGLTMRTIELHDKTIVIHIRIPRSWLAPHMVKLQKHTRFYLRNSAGKAPMDYQEIRDAFAAASHIPEKIESFRESRLKIIDKRRLPVMFEHTPRLVLHIVPLANFSRMQSLDLSGLPALAASRILEPLEVQSSMKSRYNIDGFLTYSLNKENIPHSYVQVYRNGIFEIVDTGSYMDEGLKTVAGYMLEHRLMHSIPRYFSAFDELNINPPVFIMMTLLRVKHFHLRSALHYSAVNADLVFDRNTIVIPGFLLENFSLKPEQYLSGIFDMIWNAAGHPRSPHFDSQGLWRHDQHRLLDLPLFDESPAE